jgi:hypothetical protein
MLRENNKAFNKFLYPVNHRFLCLCYFSKLPNPIVLGLMRCEVFGNVKKKF